MSWVSRLRGERPPNSLLCQPSPGLAARPRPLQRAPIAHRRSPAQDRAAGGGSTALDRARSCCCLAGLRTSARVRLASQSAGDTASLLGADSGPAPDKGGSRHGRLQAARAGPEGKRRRLLLPFWEVLLPPRAVLERGLEGRGLAPGRGRARTLQCRPATSPRSSTVFLIRRPPGAQPGVGDSWTWAAELLESIPGGYF